MRIRYVFPFLLMFGLFLAACQEQPQPAGAKLAVVDMARLMRDSVPGKDGVKYIEKLQTDMQNQLDALQEKVEKNPQDEDAMRELQRVYATSQQRIQAEGQNVVNILLDAVQRVLNSFREQNGYDMIVGSDALASFNPKIDVTNAVMAEVDKQKIEFKPLPENAVESAAPSQGENGEAADAPAGKPDEASASTGTKAPDSETKSK